MELKPPCIEDIYSSATIIALEQLSDNIKLVTIKPKHKLSKFKTGQFINIRTNLDNKVRSYSIVNQYQDNGNISIHVQKIAEGTLVHGFLKILKSLMEYKFTIH